MRGNKMKKVLKCIRNFIRIMLIRCYDFIKDIKYCGFYKDSNKKNPWRILLLAHSIEKGLSIPEKRRKFGENKAADLLRYLKIYENKENYIYLEGKSVLDAYICYRKENNLSYEEFILDEKEYNFSKGGIKSVKKEEFSYDFKDFEKLCEIRHSVREYSDNFVTIEEVEKAIKLAKTAPSACNRQMVKVYTSNSIVENRNISEIIPGNTGFKNEKTRFLFITADREAFDYYELDQWYLNGGIFLGFLQLAFSASQIGSCIYQWPKNKQLDKKIKKTLNIPDNEVIVSVLGVGHYKDKFSILNATKKKCNDILICKEKDENNDNV